MLSEGKFSCPSDRVRSSGSLSVVLVDLDAGAESGGRAPFLERHSRVILPNSRLLLPPPLSDSPGRPTHRPVAVAAVIPPLTCVARARCPPVRRPRARVFFHPRVTPKSQSELACLPAYSSSSGSSLLRLSDGALAALRSVFGRRMGMDRTASWSPWRVWRPCCRLAAQRSSSLHCRSG